MTTDNRPRCTLAQLRARWGRTRPEPGLSEWASPRVDMEYTKDAMGGTEVWRVEKIEGKDVHLVQVNAETEET